MDILKIRIGRCSGRANEWEISVKVGVGTVASGKESKGKIEGDFNGYICMCCGVILCCVESCLTVSML